MDNITYSPQFPQQNSEKLKTLKSKPKFTHVTVKIIWLCNKIFNEYVDSGKKINYSELARKATIDLAPVYEHEEKQLSSFSTFRRIFSKLHKVGFDDTVTLLELGKSNKGRNVKVLELTLFRDFLKSDSHFILNKYYGNSEYVKSLGMSLNTIYFWCRTFKDECRRDIIKHCSSLRLNGSPYSFQNKKLFAAIIDEIKDCVRRDGFFKPKSK
ncbi:hypothetical protein CJP74_07680 [Psittacicella melopsittaci]|uniref:Uncharacterized protein n=1 Tax=Psittacicella melopsittaci TaxID=2028576 RepID=A0A3A1XZ60_9GAMM|nr:hypothetical protein [Psittacicella melopsittaci]RIY31312.1 hypothetical protein CJP74_07680 [Psittacicella melopsittaci]